MKTVRICSHAPIRQRHPALARHWSAPATHRGRRGKRPGASSDQPGPGAARRADHSAPTGLLQRVWAILLGNETEPIALAPNGTPAFFYIGHLVCFSLVLIAARRLPMSGALAAPISFHLVYLTVNRVALGGLSRLGSDVKIELASPDVAVLALVPLALSGPAFVLLRKRLEARAVKRGADEPGSTTGS